MQNTIVDGHRSAGHDHSTSMDGHASHEGHLSHGDHAAQFRRQFWVMAAIAVPTVAFSPMFAALVGYPLPTSGVTVWISPALGTVMYGWGGAPFLRGGVAELRSRKPGMMLLIALGITVAFLASASALLGIVGDHLEFWWELALLIVIMLLGHWVEMRSLAHTAGALGSLAALLPDTAERVDDETLTAVSPSDLRLGDVVLVRPGGAVPADGQIVSGTAAVDESVITGESAAVTRAVGDHVVAGTVATDSAIRVRVTATGDDTALAGIGRMVADAQASTSRAQRIADIAAGYLFYYALAAAALTAIVWALFVGSADDAITRTITVLVIACPHALGLAIPLVVSIATEKAAKSGILVKDRLALEAMRTVDTVLFDKTGTLTEGRPVVEAVHTAAGFADDEILALAAAAEADSEHPLAQAIIRAVHDRNLAIPIAQDFVAHPAIGVIATVDGVEIRVGGPAMLHDVGAAELDGMAPWRTAGAIILHVFRDRQVIGALRLADGIRPESREAIAELRARGVQAVMITGDAQAVADHVAAQLGIDRVYAGVRPADKAATVAALQQAGVHVAMVGDGVNDAPALARADVGIAIGAGTDVAAASAGVILASDDPRAVLSVIELSAASYRKMKQNLWWAAGYNVAAVPLAAGILAPVGFLMPMSVGAILMSLSTIIVAANAQVLRRIDLTRRMVTRRRSSSSGEQRDLPGSVIAASTLPVSSKEAL